MELTKNKYFPFFIIFLATVFFYLPIFINPKLFLDRNNDLQEFFYPIIHFVKNQILINHQVPFWNNVFFGGTPLLPDPQSPLFYIPNVIFLLLPIGLGFIISSFLHSIFAGIGVYLTSRDGFGLSKTASIFAATIYIISPKFAGYLEAGHFGLITAWAFLPFIVFCIIKLTKYPNFKWSIILAFLLSGLFFSHLPTFFIALAFSTVLLYFSIRNRKSAKKNLIFFVLGIFIVLVLTSVTLFPQLSWMNKTTRSMLLLERDVYPKWTSKYEFVKLATIPWISGTESIKMIETEKTISLGFLTLVFALIGFLKLTRKKRLILFISITTISLIALNNASPIYPILLSQDLYVLTRVSTRVWFAAVLIIVFLSSFGFDILQKENKKISCILGIFAIIELLYVSWTIISKPIKNQPNYVSGEIISKIKQDKEKFRVFCLNRCISQKTAAEEGIELTEGYGTLQQTNYYSYFTQLSQSYFNKYSLSLPPFEIFLYEKLQPLALTLADFNIKYIISPHELTDKNFLLVMKDDKYFLYKNNIAKPRAYFLTSNENKKNIKAPIIEYLPNKIVIDTSSYLSDTIILAEVYNPNWKAYLNGKEKSEVEEYSKIMRSVKIKPDTNFVVFKYKPF